MQPGQTPAFQWLRACGEIFPALLAAIDAANRSVCFEIYTFADSPLGVQFRDALIGARSRGVRVRILVDAVGSVMLPARFWEPLRKAGGEIRVFNPIAMRRVTIRNHRKLLVCDGRIAIIGGFNISPEYEGDGIACGWCDVGLQIEGPLATQLAETFDEMFSRAEFRQKRFMRWRKSRAKKIVSLPSEQILLSGPGRGRSPLKRALRRDLAGAKNVQLMVAYFLPPRQLRRALADVAKNGGRVQLILAGKSDVPLSRLAAQSLYRRLLRRGVEIFEYQPQILHAKLIIVDDVVYAGSSNLDTRSLQINYELMLRLEDRELAAQAREIFGQALKHCRAIDAKMWPKSRSFWQKLKQKWAYLLLNRIDPYVARRQWRALPD